MQVGRALLQRVPFVGLQEVFVWRLHLGRREARGEGKRTDPQWLDLVVRSVVPDHGSSGIEQRSFLKVEADAGWRR